MFPSTLLIVCSSSKTFQRHYFRTSTGEDADDPVRSNVLIIIFDPPGFSQDPCAGWDWSAVEALLKLLGEVESLGRLSIVLSI